MGYMHIDNLYKNQDVLQFREVYCLEKIHGTSAHITLRKDDVLFFAGGCSHESFVKLFDKAALAAKFLELFDPFKEVTIYGEGYGGKMQGMRETYGPDLKFVAFDVHIKDTLKGDDGIWLNVTNAEDVVKKCGLEFVHYVKVPVNPNLAEIDAERDADSVQAIRNGCGPGHRREGVVIRPLEEYIKNSGKRIIVKHKHDEFKETASARQVVDPSKAIVLREAEAIATEWVVHQRLLHVLDKMEQPVGIEKTGDVIKRMSEDIQREAEGEVVWSQAVDRAVGKATALLFKQYLKEEMYAQSKLSCATA